MKRIIFVSSLVLCFSALTFAQPRPAEKAQLPALMTSESMSIAVKYQGGLFGFSEKETGTLSTDDVNERLVFFGKDRKEKFGIPYKSLMIVSPEATVSTATTGKVMRHIPLPGAGLFGLMREKKRFLVVRFDDPDVDVRGVVNFKVDDKVLMQRMIQTIGVKAKLTQRGDTVYRPRPIKREI
ncbi:MAG: hypothetical protein M3449_04690 [Acidobacteriota bacterium]|nr:hypothetical protein [Acidobacteriota bacterium]MDQ3490349.1 hypothetical protein [Acidobacteriota bacterium]